MDINGLSTAINGLQTKVTQQRNTLVTGQSANAVSAVVTQQGSTITAQETHISQLIATVSGVIYMTIDISQVINGIEGKLSASQTIKVMFNVNGKQYLTGINLNISN
ncbi:MAG: hypothetical protein ACSLEM_06900 [Candidatus Malihini olakiniferum]